MSHKQHQDIFGADNDPCAELRRRTGVEWRIVDLPRSSRSRTNKAHLEMADPNEERWMRVGDTLTAVQMTQVIVGVILAAQYADLKRLIETNAAMRGENLKGEKLLSVFKAKLTDDSTVLSSGAREFTQQYIEAQRLALGSGT